MGTYKEPIRLWVKSWEETILDYNEYWCVGETKDSYAIVKTKLKPVINELDLLVDIEYRTKRDSTTIRPKILDVPREITYKGEKYILEKEIIEIKKYKEYCDSLYNTSDDIEDDCY